MAQQPTGPTTKGDTTMKHDIAAIEAAHAEAVANDAETAWSPAWIANRMAFTDATLTRVKDTEGCCGGMKCMHYINKPVARVRGKGAAKATGNAIGLTDALMVLRGRGA